MCLILIAYRRHPRYPLLVAANRDEFHDRPTAPLAFWDDLPQIIAGRDLKEGGTWMGIDRTGRFAAITNYRDPSRASPNAPSRGHLVSNFLRSAEPARVYLDRLAPKARAYNGFNQLLELLADRTLAPDSDLPRTGVPLEWERWLSPIFIDAPGYGTRSSTALRVDAGGRAWLVETTWADGSRREFQLDGPSENPA